MADAGGSIPKSRRRSNPLQLYQHYRESWEKQKPPGADSRLKLRWDIREHCLIQPPDGGTTVEKKSPRGLSVNTYVVPTDKSRMQLRWQVRQNLAQGVPPPSTSNTGSPSPSHQSDARGSTEHQQGHEGRGKHHQDVHNTTHPTDHTL